ncbi:MAG: hypothetical protein K0S44_1741 [Bacteroidetes bacterium]|jgi:hypothetical protein|nr:hypothetical protein [Bacteroidota bacterium]
MIKKFISPRSLFIATVILVAAVSRLFPHIPNFTPIAAMALFGAVYFENKIAAVIIPLVTMVLSDIALELLTGWGFHNTIVYVYVSFILASLIGFWIRNNTTIQTIVIGSITSSILFFIITNFGVWAASGFPAGIAGLNTTYVMGVPFFSATLLGDLFYNAILFGTFYLAQRRTPALIRIKK